jgi:2,4-dichlorophenol 6-monooxygenase
LVGHGRFTLITGIGGESWGEAAEKIAAELGVEIAIAPVGYRLQHDDVYGDWARIREIADGGALLVRPDRHIAWRSHDRVEDPLNALRDAVRSVLALD